MSKIITISGSAQHGKDTCATYMREYLMSKNKNVMIIHFADVLKFVAKQWYGWDGVKDEHGRTILQYLGTDVFRKNRPDCWATIVKELILGMGDTVDFVIEPDCRFPNEIIAMREIDPTKVCSIKVVRPNFDNGLTEEQKGHISETALNNWKFDYIIDNSGDVESLRNKVIEICDTFLIGEY